MSTNISFSKFIFTLLLINSLSVHFPCYATLDKNTTEVNKKQVNDNNHPNDSSSIETWTCNKKNKKIVEIFTSMSYKDQSIILKSLTIIHKKNKPRSQILSLFPMKGKDFVIRRLKEEDAKVLYEQVNEITKRYPKYYDSFKPALAWGKDVEMNKMMIKCNNESFDDTMGYTNLGIYSPQFNTLIGIISLQKMCAGYNIDLGYYRVSLKKGKGIMTKAISLASKKLCEKGYKTYIVTHKDNHKSQKVAIQSGHQLKEKHHSSQWPYPMPEKDSLIFEKKLTSSSSSLSLSSSSSSSLSPSAQAICMLTVLIKTFEK